MSDPKLIWINPDHMGRVAALGCWACRRAGVRNVPAEVHHILEGRIKGRRSPDEDTIPLCPQHHRTGGHGVAIHEGSESWRAQWGSELDMLRQVLTELRRLDGGYDPLSTRFKIVKPQRKIPARGFGSGPKRKIPSRPFNGR